MSTATAPNAEANQSPAPSSDEAILAQLATLQDMHDKIFHLRSLLPERLIEPVRAAVEASQRGAETPIELAAHLRAVAVDGNRDVQAFKALWHSEDMKALMSDMKGKPFPQGRDVWAVDYRELAGEGIEKQKLIKEGEEAPVVSEEVGDVGEVVKKFQDGHPTVGVDVLKQEDGSMSVNVLVAGQGIRITRLEDKAKGEYEVEEAPGSSTSALKTDMIQSLRSRSHKGNLAYLLDMIASYNDVRTRTCDKCQQVFDKNLQLPTLRAADKAEQDGNDKRKFLAFHRGCDQVA